MADREIEGSEACIEKAIKGLEACVYGECTECPYCEACSGAEVFAALAHDALELLKAQQSIKPHRNFKYLSDFWCDCGWHLGRAGSVKFCPECGRKVAWE